MHKGISIFPTDASITPADLARACEERGFESLWVAEHSHIPVSRKTPFPGGGDLPKMYYDVMDPFVCLASAATVTKRLKIATGVCLLIQRDVIQTAKQVASLDRISNGRFLFGIGGGWNAEEMANHGTRFENRFRLLRERVEAMKAIWTQEKAEYHGELVDFDPVFAWPKPVQKPHPPIHVGGAFPAAARRAIRYGDGWVPILGPDAMARQIAAFRAMAKEAGRDPGSLEVTLYGFRVDADHLSRARDAGADRVVFFAPPFAGDEALRWLDTAAAL
ncbi:MAG TPA: LLM class F420-dependent oxidoreductase [Myxococcota bacterium]|jgi:probable F420-dependent oxidoreductase